MEFFLSSLASMATAVGGKIVLAVVVFIVGEFLIKTIIKWLAKSPILSKAEGIIRTFTLSFVKIGLQVIMVISIIGIMGVPMASVVAVLASAGVAVGLALQGALSNLAGGIMLMVFQPFQVGDYISAAGVEGSVKEVTLFYTVLVSVDNKRITVPNGSLMNTNIVDCSSEPTRRVDLAFACAKSEDPAKVQDIILEAIKATPRVLTDPEPFARISGGDAQSMEFAARGWCNNADYWTVYHDMLQNITEALAKNNVAAPTARIYSINGKRA